MHWTTSITLSGATGPYKNLPKASELLAKEPQRKPWELELPEPIAQYAASDPYPVPATEDREGYYGPDHLGYWLGGLAEWGLVTSRLAKIGLRLEAGDRMVDLGCASGRVLRHFLCQSRGLDLWGFDLNRRHVEWIRQFLGETKETGGVGGPGGGGGGKGGVCVAQNSVLPTLPLEDNSASLIYASSVFTHIDAFETTWIAELRRILRPGGVAYLTFHSEGTWAQIDKAQPLRNAVIDHEAQPGWAGAPGAGGPGLKLTAAVFNSPMPGERWVVSYNVSGVYSCNVFHHTSYIRREWGRFLEVVDLIPRGAHYQDVAILRKRTP